MIGDFFYPAVDGPLTYLRVALTLVVVVIGMVYWRLRRRQIKKREGFDLMDTFKIVPPA